MLVPMYSAMDELMAIAKAQSPLLKDIGKRQSEATIMGRETIGYLKLVDGTLKKVLQFSVIHRCARHWLMILRRCFMYLAADTALHPMSERRKNS